MIIPVPSLAIFVSVILILSCGQTDRQTESQNQRYTHATTVGMSKYAVQKEFK